MAPKLDPTALAEIREALRDGNPLLALKLYRTRTGAGLAEAKAFIDQLLARSVANNRPSRELLDSAVARLTQASWPKVSCPGQQHAEPEDEPERLAAAALAQALLERAYELCELCRAGQLDYAAVLGQLAADCPGFSASAYEQARGDAMLASR